MLQSITILCFAASYAVALALEALSLLRRGGVGRVVMHGFASAGLVAHTAFLIYHGLPRGGEWSSLLFLSWVLAVFYLYGSIHHRHVAWGVFVLPVVLGLVLVAGWSPEPPENAARPSIGAVPEEWVWLHVLLLMLGAVGLCVGFVASLMYLVQSWKLKHKVPPGQGMQLMSLERLETMNRRAITLAFPLFSGGLLIGALLWKNVNLSWLDPKVLTAGALWLVFGVLLYLRYGLHLRGRRVAVWTIVAFGFLLLAFVVHFFVPSSHPSGGAS